MEVAAAGDDGSEPEMEIDSSDDEFELLPDSATTQNWIELIKKAAPDLGVPEEAVDHLDKFSRALRKDRLCHSHDRPSGL